jgi:UDP-N-acetylmuramoyl-tripeptide--D-alanyl-D-alanine ligase
VADEEGELFEELRTNRKSVAFVNADDPHIVKKSTGVKTRVKFGIRARNVDVKGTLLRTKGTSGPRFSFNGKKMNKAMKVQLGIPGEHNAANALAASAVGLAFRVSPRQICRALEAFIPSDKRMQVEHLYGVLVYNDTYNANPDSTVAALQTLAAAQVPGKKIAVLADMLELGERSAEEHARIGQEVARLGIEYLLTYGQLSKHMHTTVKGSFVVHYDQKNMLGEYLAELVTPGDAVLVKGSRGMKMEDVITFLKERLHPAMPLLRRQKSVQPL